MDKLLLTKTLVGLSLGVMALTACVDNNYDLENLDTTIRIGDGTSKFTLPSSSTGDIKLGNIFSLNEGSAVQEINGTYFVNTSGNTDPNNINIKVISIPEPTIPDIDASLDLREAASSVKKYAKGGYGGDDLTFKYDYDISEMAHTEIKDAKATGISADLIAIDNVGIDKAKFTLNINISGHKNLLKAIHFNNLKMHLPKGLTIESLTFLGQEVLTTDDLKKAATKGYIDISSNVAKTDYEIGTDPMVLTVTINGAKVASENSIQFNKDLHTAEMTGEFQLEGYASLSNEDIDETKLLNVAQTEYKKIIADKTPAEQAALLKAFIDQIKAGDYMDALALVVPSLQFTGKGYFGGESTSDNIALNSFTGKVHHSIKSPDPIELNDLPDFLREDDVTLDLSNPQVFLKLDVTSNSENFFNETMSTGVELQAFKDGEILPTATANTGTIEFKGKGAKQFTIIKRIYSNTSISKESTDIPEEYKDLKNVIEDQYVKDLGTFLNKVPNKVEINGLSSSDIDIDVECTDLKLPQDLDIALEYKVYTPLSFGKNFQVTYRGTEGGMAEDFDDMTDFNFGGLEIEANVESTIPLPVELSLIPIDRKGNEINATKELLIVTPIKVNANAKADPIKITMKPANGYTFNNFITGGKTASGENVPQLDGFKYKAVLGGSSTGTGQSLSSSQYLKLKDVKISLLGGFTYYDNEK